MASDEGKKPGIGAPRKRNSTLGTRRIYTGRVMNLDIDQVRFPDGTTGELELIRHSGAAAVVPFLDPPNESDARILLIRQFRYAADRFLFEIPAGRMDPGEGPIDCAKRELLEEAGCVATQITPLGGFFTTPGFIDEFIHAFMASGLTRGDPNHESDEFIQPVSHTLKDGLRMIERGEIVDAKTIVALFMAVRLIHKR